MIYDLAIGSSDAPRPGSATRGTQSDPINGRWAAA